MFPLFSNQQTFHCEPGVPSLRADSTDPYSDRFSSLLEENLNLSETKSVESARRLGVPHFEGQLALDLIKISSKAAKTTP